MVRMQVQFPEELYRQLRTLAQHKEWSLAETIRRASETFLGMYPQQPSPQKEWKLPSVDLGELRLPEEKWAEALEQDWLEEHFR